MFILMMLIMYTIKILKIILGIRVALTWFAPHLRNEFTDIVYKISEPLLGPFRILIPVGTFRIDLSPILAYYAIDFVGGLILRALY